MLDGISARRPTLALATSCRPADTSVTAEARVPQNSDSISLDSKEFKVLLNPAKFENVDKGIKKLWNRIEDAADEAGVATKKAKHEEVRTQDIIFLDTENHTLKDQGYILRYRDVHGSSKSDNLTLKFRDGEASRVASADVEASSSHQVSAKFELDETFQEQEGRVYSRSSKVKVPELPSPTVENMTEYFPVLGQLGLDPSTKLKNPHEGLVEERHLLGNIKIADGEAAPAYLTLWYDDEHQSTPAVAEFSFAHAAHQAASEIDQNSEELMRNLRDDSPKWLSQGSTKTNFAYSS